MGVTQQALRFNDNKPQISYVLDFGAALADLAAVMEQGATKYEPRNWLKGGKPVQEYLDSMLRHLLAYQNGEVYDSDIGTKHLANVAWNALAALRLCDELQGPSVDPEFDQAAFEDAYS